MLELKGIHAGYGSIRVLENVSIRVGDGEIVCLLGANGAGKTTTLSCVSGFLKVRSGSVVFDGQEIVGASPENIVAKGLVQVPERRAVFPRMSVEDNLTLGAWTRSDRSGISGDLENVLGLFPRLKERLQQFAGTLSGGEQQMLMIGRALMSRPKLIMFDEPSLGLSPLLVQQVFEIINKIHEQGTSILLVEQNARIALKFSRYGYVLENGVVALEGPAEVLKMAPEIEAAYLG